MSVSNNPWSKPVGANQGRIYPITATGDVLTGGVTDPTYGTSLLIGCLQTFQWDRDVLVVETEGNDTICDVFKKTRKLTFELGLSGVDLNLYEQFTGDTAVDFAGGSYIDLLTDSIPGEFGIIVRALNSAGGDTHIILWRAGANEGPGNGFEQGSAHDESWSGDALVSYYGDGSFGRIINHEVLIDVPAVWPGTTPY